MVQQMQQIKAERMNQKAELFMKYKMEEDNNRQRIQHMRKNHMDNVEHSKKHVFDSNNND